MTGRVDKGKAKVMVYLDFQKVFDKIPHRRSDKVRAHGVGSKMMTYIGN